MPRNDRVEWTVAYAPGAIEARGYRAGKLVETTRVETTGPATELALIPNRTKLTANGCDTTVFTVEARDAQGRVVPTACLPVKFTITDGKILGVGNGDPSCLEADQYHPTQVFAQVAKWRGCMVAANTMEPSMAELKPLMVLGDWKAPLPKPGELYELAADFSTTSLLAGAALELFLPSFGSKTTVWLNGREMVRDLDTTAAGPSLKLDASMLVSGENHLRLIVAPFDDGRRRLPQLERLGSLRVTTAAPQVQRSLFNGLAQVVVQAPRSSGELRLVAEADGLKSAAATVSTVSGPVR